MAGRIAWIHAQHTERLEKGLTRWERVRLTWENKDLPERGRKEVRRLQRIAWQALIVALCLWYCALLLNALR